MQVFGWMARNPLGVIAAFLSLIYGMSALVTGVALKSLTVWNQGVLVLFIVAFPLIMLAAFLWLVISHHRKLYAPGDYRSDEGFLGSSAPPESTAQRLRRDDKDISSPAEPTKVPENQITAKQQNYQLLPKDPAAQAYFVESLVLQDLQVQLRGSVQRGVVLRASNHSRLTADGIIRSNDKITAVEVKLVRNKTFALRRLRDARFQLNEIQQALLSQGIQNADLLVAIVFDGSVADADSLTTELAGHQDDIGPKVQIKVYQLASLVQKYGFEAQFEENNG